MAFKTYISELELFNFRNHNNFKIPKINHDLVVITGENGVGKTNILEAISLLTPTKGLRSAKISDLNNYDNKDYIWNVKAKISSLYGPKEIISFRKVNHKLDSRIIQIDGQAVKKKSEVSQLIKIIWVTPPMQQIFTSSTSERRNFFDLIVSNFFVDHVSNLTKYEKSVKERLKLLKDKCNDDYWLSALEKNIFDAGKLIFQARKETLLTLQNTIESNQSSFPKAKLNLINGDVSENFLVELKNNRRIDALTGRTGIGPHLYDLSVVFQKKNMPASLSSTGEQKAILFNIVIAHAYALKEKFQLVPIMLFDEIISHLDGKNRELLFDEIIKSGAQCWLTGVDPKSFSYIEDKASFIYIDKAN